MTNDADIDERLQLVGGLRIKCVCTVVGLSVSTTCALRVADEDMSLLLRLLFLVVVGWWTGKHSLRNCGLLREPRN